MEMQEGGGGEAVGGRQGEGERELGSTEIKGSSRSCHPKSNLLLSVRSSLSFFLCFRVISVLLIILSTPFLARPVHEACLETQADKEKTNKQQPFCSQCFRSPTWCATALHAPFHPPLPPPPPFSVSCLDRSNGDSVTVLAKCISDVSCEDMYRVHELNSQTGVKLLFVDCLPFK